MLTQLHLPQELSFHVDHAGAESSACARPARAPIGPPSGEGPVESWPRNGPGAGCVACFRQNPPSAGRSACLHLCLLLRKSTGLHDYSLLENGAWMASQIVTPTQTSEAQSGWRRKSSETRWSTCSAVLRCKHRRGSPTCALSLAWCTCVGDGMLRSQPGLWHLPMHRCISLYQYPKH